MTNMKSFETQSVKENLDYVASVLRNSTPQQGLRLIYFLWAVLIPIGFALQDFSPRHTALFWSIAGPTGGIASYLITRRSDAQRGEQDVALYRRYIEHWLVCVAAFFLLWLPAVSGSLTAHQIAPYFLLTLGLSYALEGVHLERPSLPIGIVMMCGYVVLTVLTLPYVWTITGVVVSLGLCYAGIRASR